MDIGRFQYVMSVAYDYRPCIVDGRKALFHKWESPPQPVPPSTGGILALVEYEDGTVEEVGPDRIKFDDHLMGQFTFMSEQPADSSGDNVQER